MPTKEPPSAGGRDLGEVLNTPNLFVNAPDVPEPVDEPAFAIAEMIRIGEEAGMYEATTGPNPLVRSRWPKAVGRDTVDLTALPDPVEGDGD